MPKIINNYVIVIKDMMKMINKILINCTIKICIYDSYAISIMTNISMIVGIFGFRFTEFVDYAWVL